MLVRVSRFPVGSSARMMLRIGDQRARDRDALLLAAGELVRHVVMPLAESDRIEGRQRALVALTGPERILAAVEQREFHVVERRGAREQVEALEHEADALVAHHGQFVLRRLRDILAGQHVLPARRTIETPHDVHERGLARAGRARDRDELAVLDGQGDAAQGADLVVSHLVYLRQVFHFDDGHVSSFNRATVYGLQATDNGLRTTGYRRRPSDRASVGRLP